jgi:chemotaxis signal transduction protein
MDELEAFESDSAEAQATDEQGVEVTLVVIAQGALQLGVEAHCVESVVPWQTPAALPQVSPWVLGVIQDRGRLVAVRRPEQDTKQFTRVVLCTTSRGLIGLPATETRSIGNVRLRDALRHGVPLDSSVGTLTVFDAEVLASQMTGE